RSVTLGVDYKDFNNNYLQSGIDNGNATPITYIPISAGYNATIPDEGGVTEANATLNFNIRGLDDRNVNCNGQLVSQFECMRYDAKPNYFYIRAGVDTTRNLPKGLSVYGKVDGQVSSGPLISNEEYMAGGANSVRGYFLSEQAGDDAIHGTLELRGPQWASVNSHLNDLRSVVFVDAAHLRVREPLPGQLSSINMESAGFGLRLSAFSDFSLTLDVAWPFKSTVYTPAGKPVALVQTVIEN
ncbi:MAG TPA: BamA/TamA family outer membrane protein, partial [Burkholderiales bacterium]|nr:BamA/TamA family outer membrane protein [Burkholderiales bacterium]